VNPRRFAATFRRILMDASSIKKQPLMSNRTTL
jgi:hypothetical protein